MKKRSKSVLRIVLPLLIGLFVLSTASAQTPGKKETPFRKFGIGVGYGYRTFMFTGENEFMESLVKDISLDLHPIEISFQYRLTPRHTLYLTVPWMVRKTTNVSDKYHIYFIGESFPSCRYDTQKAYTYGVEAGYDFTITTYKGFSLFAGAGIGMQYYKVDTKHDLRLPAPQTVWENYMFRFQTKTTSFSFLPQAGITYSWRFITAELKYRFYITRMGSYSVFDDYADYLIPDPFHHKSETEHDVVFRHGLSGSLFFYF